jgi:hypothetical protein
MSSEGVYRSRWPPPPQQNQWGLVPNFEAGRSAVRGSAADIGCREVDAVFLEGIWQQAQRGFLDGAFTGVWVRRFLGVGLLVFLRECDACGRGKRNESYESTGFQDATREWLRRVMAIVIKRPHHIIHVTPMQRAIPGSWCEFLVTSANTGISASHSLATR